MASTALLSPGDVHVPMDVPGTKKDDYVRNYLAFTKNTGRVHLFAGDQKIEHLNDDFHGKGIHADDADPEHLFRVARKAHVSCLAVQLGYASLYARDYADVPLLIKLNSKTSPVKTKQRDPRSRALAGMDMVLACRDIGMNVVGIGYTIYPGSEYETEMLAEGGAAIHQAHRHGLLAVVWSYPRGKAIEDEKDPHLIAGAAGVAMCLGPDFVKVNYPEAAKGSTRGESFKEAVAATGRCRVITAGGSATDPKKFFERLHEQIHVSGASGAATGRNIHQKSLDEAVRMSNAMAAMIFGLRDAEFAMQVFEGKAEYKPQ